MTMSCTITEEIFNTVKKVTFAWVSSGAGAASGTTTNVYSGKVERLVTVPGAAALAPDPNYNVVINDEDTTDVLMAGGKLRHTSNTEQVLATSLGIVANDKLSLAVDSAGADNTGTVYLYIR